MATTTIRAGEAREFINRIITCTTPIIGRFVYMQNTIGTSNKFYAFLSVAHTRNGSRTIPAGISLPQLDALTIIPFYGVIPSFGNLGPFNAAWEARFDSVAHMTRHVLADILSTQKVGALKTRQLGVVGRRWLRTRASEMLLPLIEYRQSRGYGIVERRNMVDVSARALRDMDAFSRIANADWQADDRVSTMVCRAARMTPQQLRLLYDGIGASEHTEPIRSRRQQPEPEPEPKTERAPRRRRRGITL